MLDSIKASPSEPIYKILHHLWHTDNKEELFSLLQNNTNLIKTEKDIIDKISQLITDIGNFPTYQMLIETNILPQMDINFTDNDTNKQQVNLFLNNCNNRPLAHQINNIYSLLQTKGFTNELYERISNLSNLIPININEEYEDPYSTYQSNYEETAKEQGIDLLVDAFNKKTGGIHEGQLVTILGYAGSLKTTMALNLSYKAKIQGHNILYVSLEMPRHDIVTNLLSCHSYWSELKDIEVGDIRARSLTDERKKYLFDEVLPSFKNTDGKLYIVDETDIGNYSLNGFEMLFRKFNELALNETGKGLELVVIDHAQLLKFNNGIKADTNTILNMYISFFRQQCINFIHSKRQCSFLVLSQANRDGWKYASKHGGMYQLTALADANELDRASSLVISVYADEQMKIGNQAKVALIKARNTATSVEPLEVFTDPSKYAFGDIMEKANTSYSGSMDDILASTTSSAFTSNIEYQAVDTTSLDDELGLDIDVESLK